MDKTSDSGSDDGGSIPLGGTYEFKTLKIGLVAYLQNQDKPHW